MRWNVHQRVRELGRAAATAEAKRTAEGEETKEEIVGRSWEMGGGTPWWTDLMRKTRSWGPPGPLSARGLFPSEKASMQERKHTVPIIQMFDYRQV